jgi:type I restriction enzyme R subunit
MLLTGFDSKYLNTLYVDKNLRHHGLIQAFSRTNRVLNGTKPFGNVFDFRNQGAAVDTAIALFSGESSANKAREIWLVDKAAVVIQKFDEAVQKLETFMKSQGLDRVPSAVPNLRGNEARAAFVSHYKEVQRLKTQLDQYTDLDSDEVTAIEKILPIDEMRGFKGAYLETAQRLKALQGKSDDGSDAVEQLDFEFVLFASAVIDYDYIMGLIAKYSAKTPGKAKMTRDQLIGLIGSDAKFMTEREDITQYIGTLQAGAGLSESAVREGYIEFKTEKGAAELSRIADKHQIAAESLQKFVDGTLDRMIFDGEELSELFAPLDLGWRARSQAETALMQDLYPLLVKRAGGREISGLSAYEQ